MATATGFSPKFPVAAYKNATGEYSLWKTSDLPILAEQKLGGAKVVLEPHGLVIPHYADSNKFCFVIEGYATVGLLSPESGQEKVVKFSEGELMVMQQGSISWWYNGGTSRFTAVFLGVTPNAYVPGVFSYFYLSGANSVFSGFSHSLLAEAWEVKEDTVKTLLESQTGQMIVQVGEDKLPMLEPPEKDEPGLVYKIIEGTGDSDASFISDTTAGLSASLTKLDPKGHIGPSYTAGAGRNNEMVYVIKGSGQLEIVDMNGKRVLEATVEKDCMFVLPMFFLATMVAGDEGLEFLSVLTTAKPISGTFAGKIKSLFRSLSPEVLTASFNVDKSVVTELNNN